MPNLVVHQEPEVIVRWHDRLQLSQVWAAVSHLNLDEPGPPGLWFALEHLHDLDLT